MAILGRILSFLSPPPPPLQREMNNQLEKSRRNKVPFKDFYKSELMVVILTFICISDQTQEM